MTESETAWLAGLIEGEGCFSKLGGKLTLFIHMADRDVLEQAQRIVGGGTVNGPYGQRAPHHRPMFRFYLREASALSAVVSEVWPWLSERRKTRITEITGRSFNLTEQSLNPLEQKNS